MVRSIRVLAVVLVVQVLAAAALWISGSGLTAKATNTPLLALKGKNVDHVMLEAPGQTKLTLVKADGVWRLPDQDDFPADNHKVEQLLAQLEDLKQGTPVATSKAAQDRFKVSDKHFERRITLAGGGKTLATLYLGTSVGVREVHAREATDRNVHSVKLAMYEVPVQAEEWEDKTVLQIPKDDIAAIDVADMHLERAPKTAAQSADKAAKGAAATPTAVAWRVAGAAQTLKPDAADKLAGLLANLRFDAVLGRKDQPSYGLNPPRLTLTLTRTSGQVVKYQLGKMADKKEEYVLKTSNRDDYFRLPSYTAEPLMKAAQPDALFGQTTVAKTTVSESKK
jgi:Domain of unknown function (DUF4340)